MPLTLLAAVAIVATVKKQPGTYVLAAVMGFYLLFGVVMLVSDYVYEFTHKVGRNDELKLSERGDYESWNWSELLPPLNEKQSVVDDERPTDLGDQANSVLQKYPWLEWLIPVALCAAMLGQLPFSVRQVSQTSDEATHLYSGYRYLKCGDLTFSPEHPPLAKVIAAAPLLAMNFAVNCAPFKGTDLQHAFTGLTWLYSQNWPAALASARMAVSVFTVGLCLLVWIAARRMFGLTTAIVASLLLIFEPNVLAYGSLVMTDVPVTCMLLFAVLGFYLWVRQRTILFFLLTALAMGLTLLAKDSGVVVVPILGALAITDALDPTRGRPAKMATECFATCWPLR